MEDVNYERARSQLGTEESILLSSAWNIHKIDATNIDTPLPDKTLSNLPQQYTVNWLQEKVYSHFFLFQEGGFTCNLTVTVG